MLIRQLAVPQAFFVRTSRDLFKNSGNTPSGANYPYRFGGKDGQKSNHAALQSIANKHRQEFTTLYGNLLNSIGNRDKDWLQKWAHPSLVAPLLSVQNIKQINPQAKIQISFQRMSFGLGVRFEKENNQYQTLVQEQYCNIYFNKNFMEMGQMSSNQFDLPSLISFHALMKSSRKLILNDRPQDKIEQTHIITFQRENKIQVSKVMGLATSRQKSIQKFTSAFFDSKEPWRVGNIDEFLKKRG